MNLGRATIVLRSRKAMEVVDLSLRFLRRVAPRPYLLLGFYVLLPAWLTCVALRYALGLPWLGVWCAALLLSWLLELPFLCLGGRLLFNRQTQAAEALRDARRSLVSFVLSRLALWLLLSLSLLTLVGPLLVAASHCFAGEALVLERARAFQSLERARTFLRGRSGIGVETVLLRFLFTSAFVVLTEVVLRAVLVEGLDLVVDDEALFEDGGSIFALLGLFASVPYTTTFRFLAYINERTRQDGWDVQVALLGLGATEHG